jgi:hypothetical protein
MLQSKALVPGGASATRDGSETRSRSDRIMKLTVSVDWRGLIHRRIVADNTFDQPMVYLDLRQVRTEARSDVPLKERGWQEALETLAFDL